MPANSIATYTQLADDTAQRITHSHQEWTSFLKTAARLYKYPYHEQLMIYAQRPNATACADYDLWNKTMRRYVRRGSKGIALIDPSGDSPKLRYVFDVADTGGRQNSRDPVQWEVNEQNKDAVTLALENGYDIPAADGLERQIRAVADQLSQVYWMDHQKDILGIIDGSYLEEYDDFNVGASFRKAASVSLEYALLSRCGLDPDQEFQHEDFLPIFDWNTSETVAALGTAVSEMSEEVLRHLEISILNYERSHEHERNHLSAQRGLPDSEPDNGENGAPTGQVRQNASSIPTREPSNIVEFPDRQRQTVLSSTRDRGYSQPSFGADDASNDGSRRSDGGIESYRSDGVGQANEQPESPSRGNHSDGVDLQLSTIAPFLKTFQEIKSETPSAIALVKSEQGYLTFGQDAEEVAIIVGSKLTYQEVAGQPNPMPVCFLPINEFSQQYDILSDTGIGIVLASYRADGEIERFAAQPSEAWLQEHQPTERVESEARRSDESTVIPSQGNDSDGVDLQLAPPVPKHQEAQLSFFPTEAAQIAQTDKAESIKPFAFTFAQKEIDMVLQSGFNHSLHNSNNLYHVLMEYQKGKSIDEIIAVLPQAYTGGKGFETKNGKLSVWYAEDGIHLAHGNAARHVLSAQVIPWRQAAIRIGEMLEEGTFATYEQLALILPFERKELAESLWYLRQEFAEKAKEYLPTIGELYGIFPKSTDDIDHLLTQTEGRSQIAKELHILEEAYRQDRSLLRSRIHHPTSIANKLAELEIERREFDSRLPEIPTLENFITQDEIDHVFTNRNPRAGGDLQINAFFQENHTQIEKAALLKEIYGIGGSSHALSGASRSWVDYSGKGICFQKDGCQDVSLSWITAAKRIDHLITNKRYLEENRLTKPSHELNADHATNQLTPTETAVGTETPMPVEPVPEATMFEYEGRSYLVDRVNEASGTVNLQDVSFVRAAGFPIFRVEPISFVRNALEAYEASRIPTPEIIPAAENFRITDDHLGEGGAKSKYSANIAAIRTLQAIEADNRSATPDEQETLSRYVGWGGLPQAFDENAASWTKEYTELKELLPPSEYASSRASTLNAHYTSPTVIRAIYDTVERMGFTTGNILEPACGVGNFLGLLPESMQGSNLYGVELDSLTGRIAQQLYPKADITVAGFETTDRRDFYDLAIGNVPFGNYKVSDKAYDKLNFNIHDYFFAKSIDQVRPGGVVAFITSKGTMDKQSPEVRKYIAQRAELLGAVRLPNNAFKSNAGTEVTSDILFLQKRDRAIDIEPSWVHLGVTEDEIPLNSYFVEHPEMVLGKMAWNSSMYGDRQETTCIPLDGAVLADQLATAMKNITGQIAETELSELGEEDVNASYIPADPNVKNFSYTLVDGEVYYRENSRMVKPELNATAKERVKGLVELRDCVRGLIDRQMDSDASTIEIQQAQTELNSLYDAFSTKHGLINSRGNANAFSTDSSYYLLCSLEILDENGELARKADMFTKRTIRPSQVVEHVDTASEALALSIAEKAKVDMVYMSALSGKTESQLASELKGAIYQLPTSPENAPQYVTADEYLSGNIREKLAIAQLFAENNDLFQPNVKALEQAMPKALDASEIDVRLGATWIDKSYIQQFMTSVLETPFYVRNKVKVNFSPTTAEWNISNQSSIPHNDVAAHSTYGTNRATAYRILVDTLNLRDVRIYDTVRDPDGKEKRVLNKNATTLAQQKQQSIKDAFRDWVWQDPTRRQELVDRYNVLFNSTRPRGYDGQHINFSGMNPEISLRPHQRDAIAHILYGGNTLLAHEVGAGKTFEMVAAVMESKRLGLCNKALLAVPNHLTEQWASEFLRLYPAANILVATKKDFETKNRKKFCARIATGDYDAIIIGHSQFERIPVSQERQERLLEEQINEINEGIAELKEGNAERFSIKQAERSRKMLETRLKKLTDTGRKDDVVTFEQLGVDRLYVDEAHSFKNLFLYTKMRNVAGLSATDAQKSSDMLMKCRYMDEITGERGTVFATGTPVSNSMTELYTMMRYLQHDTLKRNGLSHFDSWASTFGETTTSIELAPEGTGYRARTRFAKFFNLPELMTIFKEAADIKTADVLDLPTPEAIFHNVVAQPTGMQKELVQKLSERAAKVHTGSVDPSIDNMLKITSDGRKLGLDQRVINPMLPDEPQSKVNQCVENITQIYRDGETDKLTQLVFCDISTPKADGSFTIYDDIRQKLEAQGIPANEIAFIHDANTEVKKKELFAKVRSGQVRVLMGSTFKMGAGMNVQDRLVALHDLDCPWRPGDLEQRKGRIVRQGNQNKAVHIYRYVTEGTFDAYIWQTVENKQKFISQIMTSKSPVRSCEDVDATALSFAEIKALCAGNPLIKEKMNLDTDVSKLRLLKAAHQNQRFQLEDNLLKTFPEQIERNRQRIAGYAVDKVAAQSHEAPKGEFFGMNILGREHSEKESAGTAILNACKAVKDMQNIELGSYRGFGMSLSLTNFGKDYLLTLKGQMVHQVALGTDPRGNILRIDNALATIPERMDIVQTELDNLLRQQEAAKLEVSKPFPQESELKEKSARLAELDAALNMESADEQRSEETAELEADHDVDDKPSVLDGLKKSADSISTPKIARRMDEVR